MDGVKQNVLVQYFTLFGVQLHYKLDTIQFETYEFCGKLRYSGLIVLLHCCEVNGWKVCVGGAELRFDESSSLLGYLMVENIIQESNYLSGNVRKKIKQVL